MTCCQCDLPPVVFLGLTSATRPSGGPLCEPHRREAAEELARMGTAEHAVWLPVDHPACGTWLQGREGVADLLRWLSGDRWHVQSPSEAPGLPIVSREMGLVAMTGVGIGLLGPRHIDPDRLERVIARLIARVPVMYRTLEYIAGHGGADAIAARQALAGLDAEA